MSLHALLKFWGLLGLVLGSGAALLQYFGPVEKLGSADATGHAAMVEPTSVPPRVSASDLMDDIVSEPPRMIRGNGVVLLGANVRANPSADASVLRMIGAGTYVRVFARHGEWLQVGDSKPWGWVHASRTQDLVGAPSSDPSPAASTDIVAEPPRIVRDTGPAPNASTGYISVVLLGSNVRAYPSADAPALRTISSGRQVQVFTRWGEWLRVGDREPWGWVHVSRTKRFVDAPPLPTPPAAAGEVYSKQP